MGDQSFQSGRAVDSEEYLIGIHLSREMRSDADERKDLDSGARSVWVVGSRRLQNRSALRTVILRDTALSSAPYDVDAGVGISSRTDCDRQGWPKGGPS
jgi:hypothetical protein